MSYWQTVRDDFKTLMEVVIHDHADHVNEFHESPSGTDIKQLPESTFNGAYSITMDAMTNFGIFTSPELGIATYQVKLEIGFLMNMEQQTVEGNLSNVKTDYNNAINDLELIVRKRINGTRNNEVGLFVTFVPNMTLEPLDDTQNHWLATLRFAVQGDTTL